MDLSEKIEAMKFARECTPHSASVPSHPNLKRKCNDENYKTSKCGEDLGCPVVVKKMTTNKKKK